MLFNSITFLIFLPIVFSIYWGLSSSRKAQNIILLFASYVFYAWWDYRFLSLIAFSTFIDFVIGLQLQKRRDEKLRKGLLIMSLVLNLGLLGFFKYYGFFLESWQEAWSTVGITMNPASFKIILPVGISFYTFQTLSYTIDVYRRKIEATSSLINFAGFVAFFPQLVAGPIERASHLLPQFSRNRYFNEEQAKSGFQLIIWGLFKKIVIADSCAIYVNAIFENYQNLNSASLILGAVYFAFQIYADFSGYSDIAIGTARLFGFDLMRNFNYPYFSRNIGEFWRRWHISLSTWFRDYLYIPLGGSRGLRLRTIRNIFIIFLVSGLWHGANWTFVIWGGLHALFFLPVFIRNKNRKYLDTIAQNKLFPSPKEIIKVVITFSGVTLAWVFFRSKSVSQASDYILRLFSNLEFKVQYLSVERYSIELLLVILFFLLFEWFHREFEHPFKGKFKWLKTSFVLLLILVLGVYSDHQEFIYFQF